jgi:hypothetical protein
MNRSVFHTTKRFGTLLPAVLLAGAVCAPTAQAQDAQKCSENIGKEVRLLGRTAATGQDKCHGAANKIGVSGGVCNDVTTAPYTILDAGKYATAQSKTTAKLHNPVNGKCPNVAAAAVLDKLPGDNISNKYDSLDELLTDRSTVMLGEKDLDLNAAKIKCFKAISSSRRAITDKMVNTAIGCQKSQTPGSALAASCLTDTTLNGLAKAKDLAIKKACTDLGITGAQVGSCDPLFAGNCSVTTATSCNKNGDCPMGETCVSDGSPGKRGCVSQAAIAEGKNLAQIAYPSEQCTKGAPVVDARTATVSIDTPANLGGITVKVKYPRFDAGIDENGDAIDFAKFQNYTVAFLDAFDLDDAVRISALDPVTPFGSGALTDIKFDVCRSFLPEATCSVTTGQNCTASINCRPPSCPTCLSGTQCTISMATCSTDLDCGPAGGTCGEKCIPRNRSCSLSQYINCTTNADCPATEVCLSQRNLTTCEVEAASDDSGNPVDGVTCSVVISEP